MAEVIKPPIPLLTRVNTAAVGRYDRSRDRSIESIGSIGSIIFRSFENFSKDRSRRDDRFRPKIVQIRAILAIFRPFEDFCDFRFGRFGIAFGSIDMASEGRGGPPCCWTSIDAEVLQEA